MANPGCGAVLLVEENDLFKTRPGGAYGADEYEVTFECPCCHTWNDLPLKAYGHVERLVLRWPAEKGKIYKPPTTGSGLTAPH
jgi:hypothetical protein